MIGAHIKVRVKILAVKINRVSAVKIRDLDAKHNCSKDEAHNPKLVFTQRPETRMKTFMVQLLPRCSCCRRSCCRAETAVSKTVVLVQLLPR